MLFMAGPGVLVIRAVPAKRAQAPARGRRVRSRSKPAASSRQNFDLSRVGACPGAGNLGVNPRVLSAACPAARLDLDPAYGFSIPAGLGRAQWPKFLIACRRCVW